MALALASPLSAGFAPVAAPATSRCAVRMEAKADLESLAKECNPIIGYWNPIGLGEQGDAHGVPFDEEVRCRSATAQPSLHTHARRP
jgi:hypothetical protein